MFKSVSIIICSLGVTLVFQGRPLLNDGATRDMLLVTQQGTEET